KMLQALAKLIADVWRQLAPRLSVRTEERQSPTDGQRRDVGCHLRQSNFGAAPGSGYGAVDHAPPKRLHDLRKGYLNRDRPQRGHHLRLPHGRGADLSAGQIMKRPEL